MSETCLVDRKLPASATIGQLLYKPRASYYSRKRRFPKAARQACAAAGIETVADLEGWSKNDLTDLSGIGRKSAKRLLQAADNAEVDYRGTGFPWELTVTIKVPSERVPNLREHDEDEITDALASLMTTDGLFDDVEETLREARRKELEERRAKIEAELKELSDA